MKIVALKSRGCELLNELLGEEVNVKSPAV
jgi:hypothetical protein